MRLLFIMCLIAGSYASAFAQIEAREENLRKLGEPNYGRRIPYVITFPPPIPKLTKEQTARLFIEPEESAKFETFLKTPKTSLIKLFPDFDCQSRYVVRATEACEKIIPRSSSYSFRKGDYSVQELADIRLKDKVFVSEGELSHGIIVSLGDVPIETISPSSDGMRFLSDYKPATETKEASDITKELVKGINDSNYKYASFSPVMENTTFAIRVIAYHGRVLKRLYGYFYYNVLEKDKRADIIAVFRVVKKNKDGSLLVLWKELERKDSPKIKVSKEDKEKYKIKII